MFYVSDVTEASPITFLTPLQERVYAVLNELQIPFQRVETEEAISMADCVQINHALDMKMVKTLFLCNRQKTEFYLYVTTAEKPFNSKGFSEALGISRVSFAPSEMMESVLGTKIGAATVFSVLLDKEQAVQVVFDRAVLMEDWYGCSDGTTTGYMKVATAKIVHDFLNFTEHTPILIDL